MDRLVVSPANHIRGMNLGYSALNTECTGVSGFTIAFGGPPEVLRQ